MQKFIGQEVAKQIVGVHAQAWLSNGIKPPSFIVSGISGYGKTQFSHYISSAFYCHKTLYFHANSINDLLSVYDKICPLERDKTIHAIILDEAHTLPRRTRDSLLTVLEEPRILSVSWRKDEIVKDKGLLRKIKKGELVKLKVPDNILFIFTTTHPGDIPEALRRRAQGILLEDYDEAEMVNICEQFIKNKELGGKIAKVARSPGHARLLCDLAFKISLDKENKDVFSKTLSLNGLREDGLSSQDIKYLNYMVGKESVSLNSAASYLGVARSAITEIIEKFLLRKQYIEITPRGRIITQQGLKSIGLNDEAVSSTREVNIINE